MSERVVLFLKGGHRLHFTEQLFFFHYFYLLYRWINAVFINGW